MEATASGNARFAVLDCGTNTFNLLVAEPSGSTFRVVHQAKIPVKLGKGGLKGRELKEEAIQRAEIAFKEFGEKLRVLKPDKVYISGTSAVRSARNGYRVQEACLQHLGHPMHVIDGPQEAELIFRGVMFSGVLDDLDSALIVDIGGGSCEFIMYAHKAPVHMTSIEIGVSRLTDDFATFDFPHPDALDRMKFKLQETLRPLQAVVQEYRPSVLVGSSGTFDTFEDMLEAQGLLMRREGNWSGYSENACANLCEKLLDCDLEGRLRMPGITAFRAEMLPAAAQLVLILLSMNSFQEVRTCHFAIKEGILFSLMHNKRLP
ncbi:MAG: hypothetical protein N2050_07025 [Flavobacteriales bacterium]|nr:hypothetical protein [Flavobacteriales bacterium]